MQRRGDKLQRLKPYCQNGNLEDIRNGLSRMFPMLARAFDYYAAMGKDAKHFQLLGREQWALFVQDCVFVQQRSYYAEEANESRQKICRSQNATRTTANDEVAKDIHSKALAVFDFCCRQHIGKGLLLRYEFLEAICHLSVIVYITEASCEATMLAESLVLLGQQASTRIVSSILEDANGWRKRRLYRHDVDAALRPVVGMLKSLFIAFAADSAEDRDPRMDLAEWLSFLDDHGFQDRRILSRRQSIESFLLGKMRIADEESPNWGGMAFEDFLEAIARVAEQIEWPAVCKNDEDGHQMLAAIRSNSAIKSDHYSCDTAAQEIIPLGKKVTALVSGIFSVLDE